MLELNKRTIFLSFDPSVTDGNFGFAAYDAESEAYGEILGLNIYKAIKEIEAYHEEYDLLDVQIGVIVEAPALNKVGFRQGKNQKIGKKMLFDAGMNGGIARAIMQTCKDLDIPCLPIAPSDRRVAVLTIGKTKTELGISDLKSLVRSGYMPTKTTSSQFKLLTDYLSQTNEHSRDAAMMAWKMTVKKYNKLLKEYEDEKKRKTEIRSKKMKDSKKRKTVQTQFPKKCKMKK